MSRNKRDSVSTGVYAEHLTGGGKTMNNASTGRLALTERMYIRVLTELSVNRFKWSGLPDTVDERFLELTLFYRALAVFYWDRDHSRYLALRASGAGAPNMYDNPTTFTVTGGAMINKQLGAKDCVPIWSNMLRMPDLDIVMLYATKLADIDRTIEINSHNMRYSKVITAPENERLSWQNILRQADQGIPHILGSNNLDMANIQALDLGIDADVLPNLLTTRSKMWNDCMTLLGIDNANEDKKERLVSDEVDANQEQVEMSKRVNLNARQQAAEQINRLFAEDGKPGLKVSVDFHAQISNAGPPSSALGVV